MSSLVDVRFCGVDQAFDGELRLTNHKDRAADHGDDCGGAADHADSGGDYERGGPAVVHHDGTGDGDDRRTGEQSETPVKAAQRAQQELRARLQVRELGGVKLIIPGAGLELREFRGRGVRAIGDAGEAIIGAQRQNRRSVGEHGWGDYDGENRKRIVGDQNNISSLALTMHVPFYHSFEVTSGERARLSGGALGKPRRRSQTYRNRN
jgi:hypothetical protein